METILEFIKFRIYNGIYVNFNESNDKIILDVIHNTIENNSSNSLIISGDRGSGKTQLVKSALQRSNIKKDVILVKLNGLIQINDNLAVKEIAETLMESLNCQINTSETFIEVLSSCLLVMKEKQVKIILIMEEFDQFALHQNQSFLYNILDLCNSQSTPICILAITCRLDILEILEKRVKSRFSHRQIYLRGLNTNTFDLSNIDLFFHAYLTFPDDAKNAEWVRFSQKFKSFRFPSQDTIYKWTEMFMLLMENDEFKVALESSNLLGINSFYPHVNYLGRLIEKIRISNHTLNLEDAIEALHVNNTPIEDELGMISSLELILLVILHKLYQTKLDGNINFERLFGAYEKFSRTHCPNHFYDRNVIYKVIGKMINSNIILKGINVDFENINSGRRLLTQNNIKGFKSNNFMNLVCNVTADEILQAVDLNKECPEKIRHWMHSRADGLINIDRVG